MEELKGGPRRSIAAAAHLFLAATRRMDNKEVSEPDDGWVTFGVKGKGLLFS